MGGRKRNGREMRRMSNALRRRKKPQFYTAKETRKIEKNEFERHNAASLVTKAYKDFVVVGYIILHDKFGFGQKRLARLECTVNKWLESALDDKEMSGRSLAGKLNQKYQIDVNAEVNRVPQRQLMVLYAQKGRVIEREAYRLSGSAMYNYFALTLTALKTQFKLTVKQLHEFVDKFIDYIDTLSNFSQYALTVPMIADSLAEEIGFVCEI